MAMRGLLALFFLAAPLGSNGLRRLAAPPRPRCAAATMQERQWLNVNGERVVTATKKKKSTKAAYLNKKEDGPLSDALGEGLTPRRAFLALALLVPATQILRVIKLLFFTNKGAVAGARKKRGGAEVAADDEFYAGDAVTAPALETLVLEKTTGVDIGATKGLEGADTAYTSLTVEELVAKLEERGGSQLAAASGSGRWVLPWVGGWQRVWTAAADAAPIVCCR